MKLARIVLVSAGAVAGTALVFLRWLGREAKEVTLLAGFGLLFAGLARVDVTVALTVTGALLVRLAWPTPPAPALVCAAQGALTKQPTGSR